MFRAEHVGNPQSRNALAKLIHVFPSHLARPRFCTLKGMLAVSISSSLSSLPSLERNPTMIFGTPSKKDWIQNFSSLRSKFSMSRSFRISALVLSSTHLMGAPFSGGFESQTVMPSVGRPAGGAPSGATYLHLLPHLDRELFCRFPSVPQSSTGPCCLRPAGRESRCIPCLFPPRQPEGWRDSRICNLEAVRQRSHRYATHGVDAPQNDMTSCGIGPRFCCDSCCLRDSTLNALFSSMYLAFVSGATDRWLVRDAHRALV